MAWKDRFSLLARFYDHMGRFEMIRVSHLQALCLLYAAAWCIFPPLAVEFQWRVLLVLALGGWFGLELIRNTWRYTFSDTALIVIAIAIYTTLVRFAADGPGAVNGALQFLICMVLAIIALNYARARRWRELEWLTYPLLALILVSAFLTVRGLEENSHAARIIVRSSAEAAELLRAGVGGYQLIYGLVIFMPIALGIALVALPRNIRLAAVAGA
ncbi:MAG: hypothetical protein AAF349_21495, partial [Cyanobacteria bacterium P01_A01_bin.68]